MKHGLVLFALLCAFPLNANDVCSSALIRKQAWFDNFNRLRNKPVMKLLLQERVQAFNRSVELCLTKQPQDSRLVSLLLHAGAANLQAEKSDKARYFWQHAHNLKQSSKSERMRALRGMIATHLSKKDFRKITALVAYALTNGYEHNNELSDVLISSLLAEGEGLATDARYYSAGNFFYANYQRFAALPKSSMLLKNAIKNLANAGDWQQVIKISKANHKNLAPDDKEIMLYFQAFAYEKLQRDTQAIPLYFALYRDDAGKHLGVFKRLRQLARKNKAWDVLARAHYLAAEREEQDKFSHYMKATAYALKTKQIKLANAAVAGAETFATDELMRVRILLYQSKISILQHQSRKSKSLLRKAFKELRQSAKASASLQKKVRALHQQSVRQRQQDLKRRYIRTLRASY